MTRRLLAATLMLLCGAGPVWADGLYLSLEGGGGTVGDWEHTRTTWTPCGPETTDARARFDTGIAAFGAAGYALGAWRFEIEGGFRRNELAAYAKERWIPPGAGYTLDMWSRGRLSSDETSGEPTEASLMANVIYDIQVVERFSLSLGVGAGGDAARLRLDKHGARFEDEDLNFAVQALAGANYVIAPATTLFVAYRISDVRDVGFDLTSRLHIEGDDFQKQAGTVGVRFALFVPDAAPPAPPPTVPAIVPLEREFMVFFGFNQAGLSAEALATIKQVVGAVRSSGSAAIHVVGHADRAGSVAYNKALSLRRAKAVRKALIAEGIAAAAISIAGRGESEPLVPTADGVREAQNRRVHISF